MLDDNEIGEVLAWSDNDDEAAYREGDQSSITTTVVCEANQKVWVERVGGTGSLSGYSSVPLTMFTGMLIQLL